MVMMVQLGHRNAQLLLQRGQRARLTRGRGRAARAGRRDDGAERGRRTRRARRRPGAAATTTTTSAGTTRRGEQARGERGPRCGRSGARRR